MSKNINTTTEIKVAPESSVEITKNSASVSIDNSISAGASVGIGNNNASIEVGANVKTGTIASASGGLDGKNAYVNVSYSDTTEAHITADVNTNYHGVGGSVSGDAYAKVGNEASANLSVGDKGVDVGAGASTGSCVGIDCQGTVNIRGVSSTAGAGVSVGDHFEVGGGGQATYEKGKVTVGISGDVAVLVGAEVDVSLTVDTKQIQHDAVAVAKDVVKVEHQVENIAKDASHTITNTTKKAGNEVKKAGNDVKKAFKKIKI
jgi:hypothetical protein